VYVNSPDTGYNARISRLEDTVEELQDDLVKLRETCTSTVGVQEAAAKAQALPPENLYAPLRSDTKSVTALSALVRNIASIHLEGDDVRLKAAILTDLVYRARELLSDLT
jgi:hypothetical protein